MNRKAVNPIIATMFLILIGVAIAGLIWNWSQSYTRTQTQSLLTGSTEQVECTYAGLFIRSCSIGTGGLFFTLQNSGSVDMEDGFTIILVDADNTQVNATITNDLSAGDSLDVNSSSFSNPADFQGRALPIKALRVVPETCSNRYTEITSC